MAAEKTKRAKKSQSEAEEVVLKLRSDPRSERRFEPKATPIVIASMVALSVAAVMVGAGVYGQWFRAEELGPHPWAKMLMAGGAGLLAIAALFGPRAAECIRVGDAGVAAEKGPSEIERIAWYAVKELLLDSRALTVKGAGLSIVMPLPALREAVGETLREARVRMPKLVERVDMNGLDKEGAMSGETLPLEMPQVTGQPCQASGKPIQFERDARLCGRCGAVYHKDTVPKRCKCCDARLK
ncbi:MAG: hypothetical protein IPM54_39025 [Polyangiaceae bacterium]|nr:hypothetical protein [Polyangiaceae bacterium]